MGKMLPVCALIVSPGVPQGPDAPASGHHTQVSSHIRARQVSIGIGWPV